MPRRPRVTGDDLVKALQRRDFRLARIRGSHHVLHGPSGQRVVVPVHGNGIIAPGTLANILGQAGLSDTELIELLKG